MRHLTCLIAAMICSAFLAPAAKLEAVAVKETIITGEKAFQLISGSYLELTRLTCNVDLKATAAESRYRCALAK